MFHQIKNTLPLILITTLLSGCTVVSTVDTNTNSGTSITDVKTTVSTNTLDFDENNYVIKTFTSSGEIISYRAFEKVVYVSNPVDTKYQIMNIYVPEAYYSGNTINGYTIDTAPIFFPNKVGGYMPAEPGTVEGSSGMGGGMGMPMLSGSSMPGVGSSSGSIQSQIRPSGDANSAIKVALMKGYIVASPGARGRTTVDANGKYIGKAPAGIVDLKAAVAYLHYNDAKMPGDANKIISNGTSAGGAMSSLLGATGDNKDYETYLREIGAADASTSIFAVSAYCPITNLENADMAYEWFFDGVYSYKGRTSSGTMTDMQIALSKELAPNFVPYFNSLGLKDAEGNTLSLNTDGDGSFKEYLISYIQKSAQKALDNGTDLSDINYLTIADGKIISVDYDGYIASLGRMKTTPAFDGVDLSTGENNLFGDENINNKHFTEFGMKNDTTGSGEVTDMQLVKLMNPMNYIVTPGTNTAKNWRIRVGSKDADTSTAISLILATALQNKGINVDYAIAWGIPHSGDYDTDELTAWIDSIAR